MSNYLPCPDWWNCLQRSGTAEVAQCIHANSASFLVATNRCGKEYFKEPWIYSFLNDQLRPVLVSALQNNEIDPSTREFLNKIYHGINVQFESFPPWNSVALTLHEYCLAQTLSESTANHMEVNGQFAYTEQYPAPLYMESEVDMAAWDSVVSPQDSGYGSVTSQEMPSPEQHQLHKSSISVDLPEPRAVQPTEPITMVDKLNQMTQQFTMQLARWKAMEQRKEQKCVDAESMEQNNKLLVELEGLADTIVYQALLLLKKKLIQPDNLESFIKTLLVIKLQPDRVIVRSNKFTSTLRVLLGSAHLKSHKVVNVVLLNQENNDVLKIIEQQDDATEKKKKKKKTIKTIKTKTKSESGVTILSEKVNAKDRNSPGKTITLELRMSRNPDQMSPMPGYSIHDEFYWLLYELQVQIKGYDKLINISTISFPIKVTSHQKQRRLAIETLNWANIAGHFDVFQLADMNRNVPFTNVCQTIQAQFKNATGREPSIEDFQCVAKKFFGAKFNNSQINMSLDEFRLVKVDFDDTDLQHVPPSEPDDPKCFKITFSEWWWYWELFIKTHLIITIQRTKFNLWKEMVMGHSNNIGSILNSESPIGLFVIRPSSGTPYGITLEYYDRNYIIVNGIIEVQGRTSHRYTGQYLAEELNLKSVLAAATEYSTLHCPGGERIEKNKILLTPKAQQPAATPTSTVSRYVPASLRLTFSRFQI